MTEPLTVTINEAARIIGYSRWSIDKLIREGRLETIKMGQAQQARRLVIYDSIKKLLRAGKEAA